MAYLYHNTPAIECNVRREYLRDMEDGHGEFHDALIFGFDSIPGNVPLFHCLLDDGGIFSRLPISAFCWKECPPIDLHNLVLWDCFSYYPSVSEYSIFRNSLMSYVDREKVRRKGRYLFTIDWAFESASMLDVGFSEAPGQHKTGHFIELEDGNYAIQPNNRVKVKEPSFVTKEDIGIQRLLHTHTWSVETQDKWLLSDDYRYHYEDRVKEEEEK